MNRTIARSRGPIPCLALTVVMALSANHSLAGEAEENSAVFYGQPSSSLSAPAVAGLHLTDQGTIEFRVQALWTGRGDEPLCVLASQSPSGTAYSVHVSGDGESLIFFAGQGRPLLVPYPFLDGEWHHVAIVTDRRGTAVYVDGQLRGADGVRYGKNRGTRLYLGSEDGKVGCFKGTIGDLRIWKRAIGKDFLANRAEYREPSRTPLLLFLAAHPHYSDLVLYADFRDEEQPLQVPAPLSRAWLEEEKDYERWVKEDQPRVIPRATKAAEPWGSGFVGSPVACEFHNRHGYNLVKLNPDALGSTPGLEDPAWIFAEIEPTSYDYGLTVKDIRLPNEYYLQDMTRACLTVDEQMYLSEYERQQSFKVSVGYRQGLGTPNQEGQFANSVSVGGNYGRSIHRLDRTNEIMKVSTKWASEFWLTSIKERMRLDPKFIEYVNAMGSSFEDHVEFFEIYGTDYALSALYGGKASYEEYFDAKTVAEQTEQELGAYAKWEYGPSFSFDWSERVGSKESESRRRGKYYSNGGRGGTFEFWDIGETKNHVPIKVALRPVHDLIRPRLFQVDPRDEGGIRTIQKKRQTMAQMLLRYLKEHRVDIVRNENASRKLPRAFRIEVNRIELKEQDDHENEAEIYGYVYLECERDGRVRRPEARKYPWKKWDPKAKPSGTSPDGYEKARIWDTYYAEEINEGPFPEVVELDDKDGKEVYRSEDEKGRIVVLTGSERLDSIELFPVAYFIESDNTTHQEMAITPHDNTRGPFNLADVVAGRRGRREIASKRVGGLGTVEIEYSVFVIEDKPNATEKSLDCSLPEYPAFVKNSSWEPAVAVSVVEKNGKSTKTPVKPIVAKGWTHSGIAGGNASVAGAGDGTRDVVLSYDVNLAKQRGGVSRRTATFSAESLITGTVSFDWEYAGMHSWYQAQAQLQVVCGGVSIDLVKNKKTSGNFTFRGTHTVDLRAGQRLSFVVGGKNFDRTSRLRGSVKISNLRGAAARAKKEERKPVRKFVDYAFDIKTANRSYAGTDSFVYMTVEGSGGTIAEFYVNGKCTGDAFSRGQNDRFTLRHLDIGKIKKITLRLDQRTAFSDQWYPETVTVTVNGKRVRVTFAEWIADDVKVHRYVR